MEAEARAGSGTSVGLLLLAVVAVGATIVSPLTAIVFGPALLVASVIVYRATEAAGVRALAAVTATIGAALCIVVLLVGLLLIALVAV